MAKKSTKVNSNANAKTGSALSGFLIALGVVGGYLALQLWILPAAGVPT
jgi:hypothetical protein